MQTCSLLVTVAQGYWELFASAKGEEHQLEDEHFKPSDNFNHWALTKKTIQKWRYSRPSSSKRPACQQWPGYDVTTVTTQATSLRIVGSQWKSIAQRVAPNKARSKQKVSRQLHTSYKYMLCSCSDEKPFTSMTYGVHVTDNGSITHCVRVQI